jgi:hypothetical protein
VIKPIVASKKRLGSICLVVVTALATTGSGPMAESGAELPSTQGKLFSASGACAVCHTGLATEAGVDVSTDSYWRSTMMANAARDPYWQAAVRKEILANGKYRDVIEDKCATCHMPMARTTMAAAGTTAHVLDQGLLDAEHAEHVFAMDGVSCTLCHQIEPSNFGQRASFSGGFSIDRKKPPGERDLFGPFAVDETNSLIMQAASGFRPVQGSHVKRSELCATCHTLYTPTVNEKGEIHGEFPEQVAFLEYLRSEYSKSRSCQECHMPTAAGAVPVANTGGEPRAPFARHSFVGGNAYMLEVIKSFGSELGATASSAQLDATVERTKEQLAQRSAALSIERPRRVGTILTAEVHVSNRAGHKLPTGFPSRRVWLHATVLDAEGRTLFETGTARANGSIVGNSNDDDPTAYEPHHRTIERADQVQIYEAILADSEHRVTTTLLNAASYAKDNRLLPKGFAKRGAPKDIGVYGLASDDGDFESGGDEVGFRVEVGGAAGPLTFTVELLHQPIGYRWAENLRNDEGPEIARFVRYYQAVPNTPALLAQSVMRVDDAGNAGAHE